MTHSNSQDLYPTIAVIGCGFLGSLFIEEFCKLSFAAEFQFDLILVDGDAFERRNAANQNVTLAQVGEPKAVVAANIVKQYDRIAHPRIVRVTPENIKDVLSGGKLVAIVDAVDNLATRQLLYEYGIEKTVPVLHMGISPAGGGTVEWSHEKHDMFALAPWRLAGKEPPKDPKSGFTPPCELVAMRALGWQVAFCGALSMSMYFGFDPEHHMDAEGGSLYWLSEWTVHSNARTPLRESWSCIADQPGVIVIS